MIFQYFLEKYILSMCLIKFSQCLGLLEETQFQINKETPMVLVQYERNYIYTINAVRASN